MGFAFEGSHSFNSLRSAQLHRVWFVMVWMEEIGSSSLLSNAFPALSSSI